MNIILETVAFVNNSVYKNFSNKSPVHNLFFSKPFKNTLSSHNTYLIIRDFQEHLRDLLTHHRQNWSLYLEGI